MDFQLSEEQTLLRDTTRDLLSRSYDAESRIKAVESDLGWSREVWTQLAETGILGLGFDPDEAGQIEVITVLTEVGRRLAPEPIVHAALGPGAIIAEVGNDAQKELLGEVAGPDALPFEAGDEIASPSWAQGSAPHYLNYRKTSIYGGSNEVQRTIIASTILGL